MNAEFEENESTTEIACRPCVVRLKNVSMEIQRYDGNHYVRDTNIQVPFYKDFLDSLRNNPPLLNALYVANGVSKESFYDHNYCIPPYMKKGFKKVLMHKYEKGRRKKEAQKTKPPLSEKVSSKKSFVPSKSNNGQEKATKKSRRSVLDVDGNSVQLKGTFSNSKRLQTKTPSRSEETLAESSSDLCSKKTTPSFIIDFTDKSTPWRNTSEQKSNDPGFISEESSTNRHHQLLNRSNTVYGKEQMHQQRYRHTDWFSIYMTQQKASLLPPLADRKEKPSQMH